jgi:hypothetical protein
MRCFTIRAPRGENNPQEIELQTTEGSWFTVEGQDGEGRKVQDFMLEGIPEPRKNVQ